MFDGLKVHPSGYVFATGPGGVLVIKENGEHIGTIKTDVRTANCAFDDEFKYLYMTSDMFLTRIKNKLENLDIIKEQKNSEYLLHKINRI